MCWGTYVVTFQLLEMKPSLHQNLPLGNWQYSGVGRTHDGIRHIQSTTSGRISPTRKSAQGMFTANGIFFLKNIPVLEKTQCLEVVFVAFPKGQLHKV